MPVSTNRRPLPALVFLLVLTVLTAIVWWRVLHRPDGDAPQKSAATSTSHSPSPPASCPPTAHPVALPAPAKVTVVVLNGTNRAGLAADVTQDLHSRGFAVGAPGNAGNATSGVGEIHYGAAGKAAAILTGFYFPGAKLVADARPDAVIDVVLGSAFDAIATPASATAAQAAARKACTVS